VGCARDCAAHLPAVLANIARAADLFAEAAFIFVENDSRDETVDMLEAFAVKNSRVHIERATGLGAACTRRTERLAIARNRYLERIAASDLQSFDYLIIVDMDEVNEEPWDRDALVRAIGFLQSSPEHAGVFANQPSLYYDMWALRHPHACPGDVWDEVMEYAALNHPVSDADAFEATFAKRLFRLPEDQPPIEVDSAFGGLGIYRLGAALEQRYTGTRRRTLSVRGSSVVLEAQVCEHVSFNSGVRRRAGRLFILPWLINSRRPPANFNPSFFRSIFRPQDAAG
jgi:hypothetical protein